MSAPAAGSAIWIKLISTSHHRSGPTTSPPCTLFACCGTVLVLAELTLRPTRQHRSSDTSGRPGSGEARGSLAQPCKRGTAPLQCCHCQRSATALAHPDLPPGRIPSSPGQAAAPQARHLRRTTTLGCASTAACQPRLRSRQAPPADLHNTDFSASTASAGTLSHGQHCLCRSSTRCRPPCGETPVPAPARRRPRPLHLSPGAGGQPPP